MLSSGHIYERGAIELWLRDHDTDPMTNERLESKNLIPAHLVRSVSLTLCCFFLPLSLLFSEEPAVRSHAQQARDIREQAEAAEDSD